MFYIFCRLSTRTRPLRSFLASTIRLFESIDMKWKVMEVSGWLSARWIYRFQVLVIPVFSILSLKKVWRDEELLRIVMMCKDHDQIDRGPYTTLRHVAGTSVVMHTQSFWRCVSGLACFGNDVVSKHFWRDRGLTSNLLLFGFAGGMPSAGGASKRSLAQSTSEQIGYFILSSHLKPDL